MSFSSSLPQRERLLLEQPAGGLVDHLADLQPVSAHAVHAANCGLPSDTVALTASGLRPKVVHEHHGPDRRPVEPALRHPDPGAMRDQRDAATLSNLPT